MNNYKTLFDSDEAEHEHLMSQHIKSPEVCAECTFSVGECVSMECDFCRMFDKTARRCRCTMVQAGDRCKYYERRPHDRP